MPTGSAGDQKRVTTPAQAKELGSDYIVVGRPITQAEDPVGRLPPLPRGVRGLMRWDTVLFDLDGTLTDSQEGIVKSVSYALERLGRELPPRDTLTAFIGPPLHESFSAICGMDEAETERAVCEFRDLLRPPRLGGECTLRGNGGVSCQRCTQRGCV